MYRKPINTHPVDGFRENGAKGSLYCVPHNCMPGLNTYSISKINNSDEAVQYYSESNQFNLPIPYVTFSDIELKRNAVLDIVYLKTRWKLQNEKLLKTCREKLSINQLNGTKENLQKDISCVRIPLLLSQFTSNLMEDPDQYFDSEYNWYFKNTIEKFQSNGKWYLACARGVNLDNLDIIAISNNNFSTVETKDDHFFEGPIFDIKSSKSNDLMIRQKAKLFVFSNNSETDTLLGNKTIYDNFNVPFTDADITANNCFTVDAEHVLKQWKDRDCIQDKYFDVEYNQSDSFMHLCCLQNQSDIIALINRQKLYLTDSRIDISKPCSVYDPTIILEQCEELSALKSSSLNDHSVYVATNHSVITLDKRMGFVHKSSHMLSNTPSLITTHCYENRFEPNEMLFLGTQIGESIVNFSYNAIQDNFLQCQNMVSSIPKPLDSLCNVRFQGHCLNPILLDRFAQCLTGITGLGTNDSDLRLFSINCVGDLFVQKMNDTTPINVDEFKKNISTTSHHVPKLNYSDMYDMSKLWDLEKPVKNMRKDELNSLWGISKEKMTSYVDHLAPLMLSPWDIDNISEWEVKKNNIDTSNDDSDCDYKTKVRYWFDKNDSLLGMEEPSKPILAEPNLDSQQSAHTNTSPPVSSISEQKDETSENSSSGYSVSLKSE